MGYNSGIITMAYNPKSLANLKPPLTSATANINPGGQPKGKRLATWLEEFGGMAEDDLPKPGSLAWKRLPLKAHIALKRLRMAVKEEMTTRNSEYVEPQVKAVESSADVVSVSAIERIAQAIGNLRDLGILKQSAIDAETGD